MFKRSSKVQRPDGPLTGETLRQWLIEHLATRVGADPADIDTGKSFEAYGLDSRVAVQVSGALEKLIERRLSPGLLYEHQTIDDLSAHLTRELHLEDGSHAEGQLNGDLRLPHVTRRGIRGFPAQVGFDQGRTAGRGDPA
jgi:acyl carrier protein